MANTSEARTETGEIKDAGAPVTEAAPEAEAQVPEAYADFTAPEGITLDPELLKEATPLFKEFKLPQEGAQKLVDLYNKHVGGLRAELLAGIEKTRSEWRDQIKADTEIGSKLDAVKVEIGRAKDKLPEPIRQAFNEAMDFTGAGDHPAIVRAFYELAKLVNEGTHVTGKAPSTLGQTNDGKAARPTAAQALYPNLPH